MCLVPQFTIILYICDRFYLIPVWSRGVEKCKTQFSLYWWCIYSCAAGDELLNMGANNKENDYYDTYIETQLNE